MISIDDVVPCESYSSSSEDQLSIQSSSDSWSSISGRSSSSVSIVVSSVSFSLIVTVSFSQLSKECRLIPRDGNAKVTTNQANKNSNIQAITHVSLL
jgi:hypothetical protein